MTSAKVGVEFLVNSPEFKKATTGLKEFLVKEFQGLKLPAPTFEQPKKGSAQDPVTQLRKSNVDLAAERAKSDRERIDGEKKANALIAAEEKKLYDIRTQYSSKHKHEDKLLTDELVHNQKHLQDEKVIILNSIAKAEDSATRKHLEAEKQSVTEQIRLNKQVLQEKQSVQTGGHGVSVGILGTGRQIIGHAGTHVLNEMPGGAALLAGIANPAMLAATALSGVAVGLFEIGEKLHAAEKIISVGTGATGEVLEKFNEQYHNVLTRVAGDTSEIAEKFTELKQRLGASDEVLEKLTVQFQQLHNMGKDVSVEDFSKSIKAFNVDVKESPALLDMLFVIHQKTGVSIDKITGLMVAQGAQLRLLGMGYTDSAALLASLDAAGVNSEKVIVGLGVAEKALAKDHISLRDGMASAIEKIKNAKTETEALHVANGMFGRGAVAMTDAIRSGKFAFEDLEKALGNTRDSIDQTNKKSQTLGEKFGLLWNQIMVGASSSSNFIVKTFGKALDWLIDELGKVTVELSNGEKVLASDLEKMKRSNENKNKTPFDRAIEHFEGASDEEKSTILARATPVARTMLLAEHYRLQQEKAKNVPPPGRTDIDVPDTDKLKKAPKEKKEKKAPFTDEERDAIAEDYLKFFNELSAKIASGESFDEARMVEGFFSKYKDEKLKYVKDLDEKVQQHNVDRISREGDVQEKSFEEMNKNELDRIEGQNKNDELESKQQKDLGEQQYKDQQDYAKKESDLLATRLRENILFFSQLRTATESSQGLLTAGLKMYFADSYNVGKQAHDASLASFDELHKGRYVSLKQHQQAEKDATKEANKAMLNDFLKAKAVELATYIATEFGKTAAKETNVFARMLLTIKEIGSDLASAATSIFEGVSDAIKWILDLVPFPFSLALIPAAIAGVYGLWKGAQSLFFGDKPAVKFGKGGIVSKDHPVMGMIGEAGEDEAITPLSKLKQFIKDAISTHWIDVNSQGTFQQGIKTKSNWVDVNSQGTFQQRFGRQVVIHNAGGDINPSAYPTGQPGNAEGGLGRGFKGSNGEIWPPLGSGFLTANQGNADHTNKLFKSINDVANSRSYNGVTQASAMQSQVNKLVTDAMAKISDQRIVVVDGYGVIMAIDRAATKKNEGNL